MTEVECFDPLTSEWTECHPLPRAGQRPGPSLFKLETNKLVFFIGFIFNFSCKSWSQARDVKHYSWRTWARGWQIESFLLSLNSKSHFRHPREQMPLGCSNV